MRNIRATTKYIYSKRPYMVHCVYNTNIRITHTYVYTKGRIYIQKDAYIYKENVANNIYILI